MFVGFHYPGFFFFLFRYPTTDFSNMIPCVIILAICIHDEDLFLFGLYDILLVVEVSLLSIRCEISHVLISGLLGLKPSSTE